MYHADFRKIFPCITVSKFNSHVEYHDLHVKSFIFLKAMKKWNESCHFRTVFCDQEIVRSAFSSTVWSILDPSTVELQSRSQISPSNPIINMSVCFCSSVLWLPSIQCLSMTSGLLESQLLGMAPQAALRMLLSQCVGCLHLLCYKNIDSVNRPPAWQHTKVTCRHKRLVSGSYIKQYLMFCTL